MLKTITINTETHKVVPLYPTAEMVAKAQFHTDHSALDEDDENHYRAKGQALAVYSEMIEAAPEFAASPWQPIETAPKGKFILGYRDGRFGEAQMIDRADVETWYFRGTCGSIDVMPSLKPTHWIPLLTAPEGI